MTDGSEETQAVVGKLYIQDSAIPSARKMLDIVASIESEGFTCIGFECHSAPNGATDYFLRLQSNTTT